MTIRTIRFQCPACDRRLRLPESKQDKTIVCPQCNSHLKWNSDRQVELIRGGQNELFGPPVDRGRVSELSGDKPLDANAFDDIDHLLDGHGVGPRPSSSAAAESTPVPRNRSGQATREVSPLSKATTKRSASGNATVRPSQAWAKEKITLSRSDEKLQRNGIGILILAAGLAALPFLARDVAALRPMLPYVPFAGIAVAFVGSFMLAWSMRRGNIGGVVWSGISFLILGLVCIGGEYYQRTFSNPITAGDTLDEIPAEIDAVAEPVDDSDRLLIDPDSIDNNPAARFRPPRQPRPLGGTKKPAVDRDNQKEPIAVNKDAPPIRNSEPKPSTKGEPKIVERQPVPDESGVASELRIATSLSRNAEQRSRMLTRIKQELNKSYIHRDLARTPDLMERKLVLSSVAGESTVYGVAYYHDRPITGFDAARMTYGHPRGFDLIVPVIASPETRKPRAESTADTSFIGMNLNLDSLDGVIGLQPIFASSEKDQGHRPGEWIGRATQQPLTLVSENRPIYGIVNFKRQLKTVGIALILGNATDSPE